MNNKKSAPSPLYRMPSELEGKNLFPVVVLKDIMKEPIKNQDLLKGLPITPPRSTPSPYLISENNTSVKRRRKTNSSPLEYEIEAIVGYHMDKKGKMWYLVKWKGFSSAHNTFELIENLTGCNYLLMKYFEVEKPSLEKIRMKFMEIKNTLSNHQIYQQLVKSNYGQKYLELFSKNCLDIENLFDKRKFKSFKIKIERDFQCIVRCLLGMQYHQDPGLFQRAQNYLICLNLISLREKQLSKNKTAQNHINKLEKTPIVVENNVDLESFPEDLVYIVDNKVGDDLGILRDPILGCNCKGMCSAKSTCCGKMAGFELAYNSKGRLKFLHPFPIYECNRRCSCDDTCPNKVVQNGRKVKVCIFKTKSCGWGVRALQTIPKGQFVCEYLGEIISDSEAVVRDVSYFKEKLSYIFDLDFYQDIESEVYCVDGTHYGNVGRFINHSCDPNLLVCPVWIDYLEPNIHRLAFFARRRIEQGEELFIDYENIAERRKEDSGEAENKQRVKNIATIKCQCKSSNCRQWVFGGN